MSVQALAAQLAVERLDERIVCGLARMALTLGTSDPGTYLPST